MYRIILTVVDIVPAAVVLVPVFCVFYYTLYRHDLRKSVLHCLFCLYLAAVFSLVGIPNVTYFRPEINLNLLPFAGMVKDLKNCILNVVLFTPLGFFLPVLWYRFKNLRSVVTFGFGLSLTIELLQMLTFRATDVNDLITNTLGAMIGFLFAKPLIGKRSVAEKEIREVFMLIALSFGTMFFAHPFLSPMIWDRIF